MKELIEDAKLWLGIAKEVEPLANEGIDQLLEGYAPILAKVGERVRKYSVENTVKTVKDYGEAGFSQREAILLTLNTKVALAEVLDKMGKNKK